MAAHVWRRWFAIAALLTAGVSSAAAGMLNTLSVNIDGIGKRGGTLLIEVYDAQSYDSRVAVLSRTVKATSGSVLVTFVDIAPGSYAVHVSQDVNSNGSRDKTFLGANTEPEGYSNYTARARKPSFRDVGFTVKTGDNKVTVHMHN